MKVPDSTIKSGHDHSMNVPTHFHRYSQYHKIRPRPLPSTFQLISIVIHSTLKSGHDHFHERSNSFPSSSSHSTIKSGHDHFHQRSNSFPSSFNQTIQTYRTLFKNPTHALPFKIYIKTQSLFRTLECLRLLCHPICFGQTPLKHQNVCVCCVTLRVSVKHL